MSKKRSNFLKLNAEKNILNKESKMVSSTVDGGVDDVWEAKEDVC